MFVLPSADVGTGELFLQQWDQQWDDSSGTTRCSPKAGMPVILEKSLRKVPPLSRR